MPETMQGTLVREDRARRVRVTIALNDVLRRIRIARNGGDLTFEMREYLETLRVWCYRILKASSRAAAVTADPRLPLEGAANLGQAWALGQSGCRPLRLGEVIIDDGLCYDPYDIQRIICKHIATLLAKQGTSQPVGYDNTVGFFCGSPTSAP